MQSFNAFLVLTTLLFSFTNKTSCAQSTFDSITVFHVTDSITIHELKVYDEQSGRQTGVPRMIEHYDRIYSYDESGQKVFVYYSFNHAKFYGNSSVDYAVSTGFPDFISIAYDLKTKKTRIMPEG